MYKCEHCGNQSRIGEKLNKLTVSTRPKEYIKVFKDKRTKREIKKIYEGFEIAKEISVCGDCNVE